MRLPAPRTAKRWQPLNVQFRPSPGQLVFHKDRHVPERLLQAGTGGGKSYACAFEVFDITMRERADVAILSAPDFPQLELSVYGTLERLFGLGKDFGRPRMADGGLEPYASFNQSKKTIHWWNGWEWRFASMDTPTSIEGLPAGAVAWLNEARLVPGFNDPDGPWLNLTRRMRGQDDRPRRAFADTHSPTYGIAEAFKPKGAPATYDLPGPTGDLGRLEVIDCLNPDRRAYQWGTKAAIAWGTLSRTAGERIIGAYAGSDAQRILEGKYARPTGVVYDAFTERNLRTWTKKKPTRWTYGLDLGWTHPAVITAHAWYGDTVHTVREKVLTRPGAKVIAAEVVALQESLGAGVVWVGYDVRATEYVEDLKALGVPAENFEGRVRDGILRLNSRLQGGSWVIDPVGCPLLVDCLRDRYEWREGTREEPKKENDDAPDSARYGILGGGHDEGAGAW